MTKEHHVIGKDGKLPWNIPADLKNFKRLTSNSTVIMGRKTYESIPEKYRPLPNRVNIVITRNQNLKYQGAIVSNSVPDALEIARSHQKDSFVIGGAQIYQEFLPLANQMHLSFIKHEYEGDTKFPDINWEKWEQTNIEDFEEFEFLTYTKKEEETMDSYLNSNTYNQEKQNNEQGQQGQSQQEQNHTEQLIQTTAVIQETFDSTEEPGSKPSALEKQDPEVYNLIQKETNRQQTKLSMIPSENFFSRAVREATGSVLAHKYAEGNIGRRYYEGNKYIDQIEQLTINRAKKAFNLPENWSVNVQTLSGSTANLSVYLALLNIGDYIMGMYLPDGGHLSHGWSYTPKVPADPTKTVYYGGKNKVNISSKIFNTVSYKTNPKNQLFDYEEIERIALLQKPKLIITGGTAYPREIDYHRMKKIAEKVGAFYLADIAHEAGLVAAGAVPSPVGIADVVTMTTHKTLKSGRGALIFAHEDMIKKINKAVLPGLLGGPFNHAIAGICVGLKETMTQEFKDYATQTITNARNLCTELAKYNFKIVSGGTDKHLVLIDLTNKALLGKKFARALDHAGIVSNSNTIPQETKSPLNPSGLRLGTPWITMRGMKESEIAKIASWINQVMNISEQYKDLKFKEFKEAIAADTKIAQIAEDVKQLCLQFPLDV